MFAPIAGKRLNIFGDSTVDETAQELGLLVFARLPIDPQINRLVDEGRICDVKGDELKELTDLLRETLPE